MTQAFRIIRTIFTLSSVGLGWVTAWIWPQTHLHTDRFATDHETKRLSRDTSFGLVLGFDRHQQILSVEATQERPHLGHLAIFGPTGAGKTRREIKQLETWKGPAIVNDPKRELSDATAEIRKHFSTILFFAPSERAGNTYDPLDGIESERKLYSLAKHLLYVPNEKEPAFTEWATKMLTQLFLAAKVASKAGRTDKRPSISEASMTSRGKSTPSLLTWPRNYSMRPITRRRIMRKTPIADRPGIVCAHASIHY
jgi:type IV secretory pathway TraG/TraD family ATPase VirD4